MISDLAPAADDDRSSADDEYAALRSSAGVVDRSTRGRMRFTGDKAGDVLAGLVTNDVSALKAGQGQYAAALTPKGRIVADVRILAGADWYLVDAPSRAWAGWTALVRKYVNPRLALYRDESSALCDVGIFGPDSARVASAAAGVAAETLAALAPYAHAEGSAHGARVLVVRAPDLRGDGFDLVAPLEIHDALRADVVAAGARAVGQPAWDAARIEAGFPEWGVDMNDETLPQEANLDELDAISYSKGCYTGQEVVARIHFRGHVNRHLRGLRVMDAAALPPAGAQLFDDAGAAVGDVRSTAHSPRLGGIALGMVRREIAPGASLAARWDAGEARVEVSPLPFPG
jgi:folate-binding protein YgfZ